MIVCACLTHVNVLD